MEEVLEQRTRHISVVVENIHYPQNCSAVIRTVECMGLQDLYVIDDKHEFTISPHVTRGASKWLDFHRFNRPNENNTQTCLQTMRDKGYTLIATSPHATRSLALDSIDLQKPVAIMIGQEKHGLSPLALDMADAFVQIPMFGFTESFNLSVSMAIILEHLVNRMRNSGVNWQLSEEEKEEIRYRWYKKSVRNGNAIERTINSKSHA